jgi:hypothetical protein
MFFPLYWAKIIFGTWQQESQVKDFNSYFLDKGGAKEKDSSC